MMRENKRRRIGTEGREKDDNGAVSENEERENKYKNRLKEVSTSGEDERRVRGENGSGRRRGKG